MNTFKVIFPNMVVNLLAILFIVSLIINFLSPLTAYGLDDRQRKLYDAGINFYDIAEAGSQTCSPVGQGFSTGSWDPLTLVYPAIPNESAMIEATKNYILQNFPRSPFAENLQYVDQIYILSAQRNVNPLLVMAVARQENGFGQAASSATAGNNYFGMKDGPINYISFDTVEDGIDYFVEKVSRHVDDPTGAYEGLSNFYEYLSIHQVGMIAYPGEYPDRAGGKDASPPWLTFDRSMGVYTSWDPTRNSHKDGSPVYNPGIYYRNSILMINELTGLSLSEDPDRRPAGQGCIGASDTPQPGANGWDIPGEGPNPMQYFYSQICESCTPYPQGYTDFYSLEYPYGISTIQQAGCGPVSVAMVVSNLTGVKVGGDEMGNWFVDNGYQHSGGGSNSYMFANNGQESNFAKTWGVYSRRLVEARGRQLTSDEGQVIAQEIRKGNFVIISVRDGPLVSGSAHITTIRAVTDDGRFLFADTADSNTKNRIHAATIPQGASRTPLAYNEVGTINTGVYVFERLGQ